MTNLSDRLQQILDAEGLRPYGAAQIIGAETDEPIKTLHARISSYLKKEPETWVILREMLDALGYEVQIIKKQNH
ncbi:MAG TPA: hypothetical protein V6C65_04060 [Allocoleopsis sp.]